MRSLCLLLFFVLGSGCSGSRESLFPLKGGNTWTYLVRGGFVNRVETVKVVSEESVAGTRGWRLSGPMGMSRLAWKGGVLFAEELPGCRVYPQVPLLNSLSNAPRVGWTGRLWVMGKSIQASGEVTQEAEKFEIAGRKYDAVVSKLTLANASTQIELKTWFIDGIGPVRQEQRINGTLYPAANYLSGP